MVKSLIDTCAQATIKHYRDILKGTDGLAKLQQIKSENRVAKSLLLSRPTFHLSNEEIKTDLDQRVNSIIQQAQLAIQDSLIQAKQQELNVCTAAYQCHRSTFLTQLAALEPILLPATDIATRTAFTSHFDNIKSQATRIYDDHVIARTTAIKERYERDKKANQDRAAAREAAEAERENLMEPEQREATLEETIRKVATELFKSMSLKQQQDQARRKPNRTPSDRTTSSSSSSAATAAPAPAAEPCNTARHQQPAQRGRNTSEPANDRGQQRLNSNRRGVQPQQPRRGSSSEAARTSQDLRDGRGRERNAAAHANDESHVPLPQRQRQRRPRGRSNSTASRSSNRPRTASRPAAARRQD